MVAEWSNKNGVFSRKSDAVISEMILAQDRPDYPHIAMHALNRLVPFDAAAMFVYSGDDLVYFVVDELLPIVGGRFFPAYSEVTYRLNPFFQHHRSGLASGTYRLSHLARDRAIRKPLARTVALELDGAEEIGYRTNGWPKGWSEIDVAVRLSLGQTAQIALYRSGADSFSSTDVSILDSLNLTLCALYTKFWQRWELRGCSGENVIPAALDKLSNGRLSRRELEVLLLGLQGFETLDIANRLGICQETVKTHRKRAYRKIGAHSKSDLSSAVMRMIACR